MSKAEKYNSPHDIAFRAREADGEKMKDVDKIASEIQSHTNQTLDDLKGKVEELKNNSEDLQTLFSGDTSETFSKNKDSIDLDCLQGSHEKQIGFTNGLSKLITLIEELQDE